MTRPWLLALVLALNAAPAEAARTPHLDKLKRLHADLVLDQPLDRSKLDRLLAVALENDLLVDREERTLLERYIAQGYDDPTGEAAPEIEVTFGGSPLKGWVARVQKLLVQALKASPASSQYRRSLQELIAIAWRPDLAAAEREQVLALLDNYRLVDAKQATDDVMTALAILFTNPEDAREDRAHRRQLELLSSLANRPAILAPIASPSFATGR